MALTIKKNTPVYLISLKPNLYTILFPTDKDQEAQVVLEPLRFQDFLEQNQKVRKILKMVNTVLGIVNGMVNGTAKKTANGTMKLKDNYPDRSKR